MNEHQEYLVNLLHCGNVSIADPSQNNQKSLFYMPMGLLAVAAELHKNGFPVEVVHLDLEPSFRIEDILDFSKVKAVGLDLHWVFQGLSVLETAALIKKRNPEVFVFLGGYTASYYARQIVADNPEIDAVIKGDGEVPAVELCRALCRHRFWCRDDSGESGLRLERVSNLVWRRQNGHIIENDVRHVPLSADLDEFDFAELTLLRNWDLYRDMSRGWTGFHTFDQRPLFCLEVGRGCDYQCTLCGGSRTAQICINNRTGCTVRSIDSVMSTIRKALSFGYSCFHICFEFEGSDDWYIGLFKRILQEELRLSLGYECWNLPGERLIDHISAVGEQVTLMISPDSGYEQYRKENRDRRLFYTNQALEETLRYIGRKANIRVQLYFAYFLPSDTEETVRLTMNYILRLFGEFASFVEIRYLNVNVDPGSAVFLEPGRYGIDLEVRNFDDYTCRLSELRRTRSRRSLSEMVLFRPGDMSRKTADNLDRIIEIFNMALLFFGGTVSLLLRAVENTDSITDYINATEPPAPANYEDTAGLIKEMITDICRKNGVQDDNLLNTLEDEYKQVRLQNQARWKDRKDETTRQPVKRLFQDETISLNFDFER